MNTVVESLSPVQSILKAHRRGEAVGLYSVCSSHELVLRAAIRVALEMGTPLLVEATSNQVDQNGGYTGMQPHDFRAYVEGLAAELGLPLHELVLGGDHLGPNSWQKLPAAEAMAHSRVLIHDYVTAGFHKIHLDCSMSCANDPLRLDDETVAARSAELAAVAEAAAQAAGLPPPVYVIGTEVPVPGGEASLEQALSVTRPEAAARTLEIHRQAFVAAGQREAWQRVIAMVVQPGVDFDHSQVQHYVPAAAAELSSFVAGQPGLVFEAHSTDYQLESSLQALVRDHYAILKVGPALTFALREALFALSRIEEELVAPAEQARLPEALDQAMQAEPRHWLKHYAGTPDQQRLLRRYALSDRCRYYWGEPAVKAAQARLFANLQARGIPLPLISQYLPEQLPAVLQGRLASSPQALVEHKIGQVVAAYARATTRPQIESPHAGRVSSL
ncbi:D-tagatose-bisphosphate aldolase, class II, non-catalytic subunit [Pelomonas sp. SE-A7]|uniref:D-tagatose-bisphosphate aldolase, class II, non-catalytic subunit n=1 Tax=Pelomonas sp. SE-A7 TaxID=3054953 RepID=UPI00259CC57A|nr:D-tagatose-bisphosphate aldolase, class II, non-catalytic subunit [Pelomonas sp. SE-A7]MDM4767668.1 D-tagatose-bisphosphate aldolase, class II, non-catalytic subunit [Pelomonas sp. SE-A7]